MTRWSWIVLVAAGGSSVHSAAPSRSADRQRLRFDAGNALHAARR